MCTHLEVGRDSSLGIGTCYGLDGPEIESLIGGNFLIVPDRPSGTPTLLYNGYRFLGRGKFGVVLALTPNSI
jgi:hypothetical protein